MVLANLKDCQFQVLPALIRINKRFTPLLNFIIFGMATEHLPNWDQDDIIGIRITLIDVVNLLDIIPIKFKFFIYQ